MASLETGRLIIQASTGWDFSTANPTFHPGLCTERPVPSRDRIKLRLRAASVKPHHGQNTPLMKFPPLISCRRIKKPMFPLGTNYQKKNMTARYDSRIEVLDLSKQPPRSPRVQIAGYVIAARAVDICRATLARTNGDYSINAPLEKHFLDFKGLDGPQFQAAVATCKSDEEVAKWLEINGARKTAEEIAKWSTETEAGKLMLDPEHRQAFLPYCESKGFSPHKDTTFDCVECDGRARFCSAAPRASRPSRINASANTSPSRSRSRRAPIMCGSASSTSRESFPPCRASCRPNTSASRPYSNCRTRISWICRSSSHWNRPPNPPCARPPRRDRKSTRLNSSHRCI